MALATEHDAKQGFEEYREKSEKLVTYGTYAAARVGTRVAWTLSKALYEHAKSRKDLQTEMEGAKTTKVQISVDGDVKQESTYNHEKGEMQESIDNLSNDQAKALSEAIKHQAGEQVESGYQNIKIKLGSKTLYEMKDGEVLANELPPEVAELIQQEIQKEPVVSIEAEQAPVKQAALAIETDQKPDFAEEQQLGADLDSADIGSALQDSNVFIEPEETSKQPPMTQAQALEQYNAQVKELQDEINQGGGAPEDYDETVTALQTKFKEQYGVTPDAIATEQTQTQTAQPLGREAHPEDLLQAGTPVAIEEKQPPNALNQILNPEPAPQSVITQDFSGNQSSDIPSLDDAIRTDNKLANGVIEQKPEPEPQLQVMSLAQEKEAKPLQEKLSIEIEGQKTDLPAPRIPETPQLSSGRTIADLAEQAKGQVSQVLNKIQEKQPLSEKKAERIITAIANTGEQEAGQTIKRTGRYEFSKGPDSLRMAHKHRGAIYERDGQKVTNNMSRQDQQNLQKFARSVQKQAVKQKAKSQDKSLSVEMG